MLIIAHRGASGYAPENTIAAMNMAINQGCDGIELDVQLTKDEVVIVHHDWTFDRTTSGSGEVKDLTYEEIKSFDAGFWFSKDFEGEKVPTLEDVINTIPKDLFLNVELKARSFDSRGLEKKVVEILEKNRRIENTVVSSFNHECLKKVQDLNSDIKLGLLYEAHMLNPVEYFESTGLNLYSIHPCNYYLVEELANSIHKKNMKIYTWTVNDENTKVRLEKLGIEGIITNYPDLKF